MGKGPAQFDAVQALAITSSPVKGCNGMSSYDTQKSGSVRWLSTQEDHPLRVGTSPENSKVCVKISNLYLYIFVINRPLSLYVIMRFAETLSSKVIPHVHTNSLLPLHYTLVHPHKTPWHPFSWWWEWICSSPWCLALSKHFRLDLIHHCWHASTTARTHIRLS